MLKHSLMILERPEYTGYTAEKKQNGIVERLCRSANYIYFFIGVLLYEAAFL